MSSPLHVRDVAGARTGMVLIHGVMSHAGWFERIGEALAKRGISTVAVDRRGSGRAQSLEGATEPRMWLDDVRVAQAHLRETCAHVALFGWCWGARLAIVSASIDAPDQLLLVAPGIAMTANVRAKAAAIATSNQDPAPLPFGAELFSSSPEVLQWISADPLAWRHQPRAFLPSSRGLLDRALSVLPHLTLPVTTLLAESDRIVDNAAVEKLLHPRTVQRMPGEHALVLEQPDLLADRLVTLVVA